MSVQRDGFGCCKALWYCTDVFDNDVTEQGTHRTDLWPSSVCYGSDFTLELFSLKLDYGHCRK